MDLFKSLIRPLLFRLDPETAHNFAASVAKLGQQPLLRDLALTRRLLAGKQHPELELQLFNQTFRSPLGLAAGFDKHGKLALTLDQLGFGFVEFGSITNKASQGNPLPRLFRIQEDQAIINRLGLNNPGPEEFLTNLKDFAKSKSNFSHLPMQIGINVAKTHNPNILGKDAVEDICSCYQSISSTGCYHVLNISCPNTKEGKTFEDKDSLAELLTAINEIRQNKKPLLVKFSSDLTFEELDLLLEVCESNSISGYVLSNTSAKRANLRTAKSMIESIGAGGLSGPPIYEKSLANLLHANKALKGNKTLIGLGGIDSAEKAFRFIKAGASLVEIYTGLIYHGPGIVQKINDGLVSLLKRDGFSNISEAIGTDIK